MELDHDVIVSLAVSDAGQAEHGPGGIVGMAGHLHAHFLAGGDDAVQEVLEVLPELGLVDVLVDGQHPLQIRQTLRLPAGQGDAVAVIQSLLHQIHRGHLSQFLLVEVQGVGTVLGDLPGQIGAQPVKHRHEVVDDDLHAHLGQVADRLAVLGDILVPGRQPHFDVLVDVDGLDDLALQTGLVDVVHIGLALLVGPHLAGGLLVQHAHEAAHAGDLLDLLQGDGVTALAVPAECHFHGSMSSLYPVWLSRRTSTGPGPECRQSRFPRRRAGCSSPPSGCGDRSAC